MMSGSSLGAAWPLAVLVDDLGHRREEIRAHQVRGVDGVVVHVRLPPKHPSLHQHRRPVGAGRVGPGDVARRVIPHGVDLAQRPAGGAESLLRQQRLGALVGHRVRLAQHRGPQRPAAGRGQREEVLQAAEEGARAQPRCGRRGRVLQVRAREVQRQPLAAARGHRAVVPVGLHHVQRDLQVAVPALGRVHHADGGDRRPAPARGLRLRLGAQRARVLVRPHGRVQRVELVRCYHIMEPIVCHQFPGVRWPEHQGKFFLNIIRAKL
mmetsp:Transcript_68887/g.158112  ORF Transcript_68887/g.158112 Transcript_68887/m.158112 type:complete len:266 (+) Transcript_68887:494-1291(+)